MRILDLIVVLVKRPADHCFHSQRREVASGNQLDVHRFRHRVALDRTMRQVEQAGRGRHIREDLISLLHFSKERVGIQRVIGEGVADSVVRAISKDYEFLRIFHRQRTQQQRVDQAENGCVGPNPECQRKQSHERDSRRPRVQNRKSPRPIVCGPL
jgi:hypothetical protein